MAIKLFNTLTRHKETLNPLKEKKAGFYACGPTVYMTAHVGNLRTFLFEDVLKRVLEYNGYSVRHVMNFTDVGHLTSDEDTGEDKVEAGAKREGRTAKEITDRYIAEFKKDAARLNIKKPSVYARATEHIKEQIELVKTLEKKGFTYKIADGLYFDTSKLPGYGELARLDMEGLKSGARVEMTEGKKNPTDFAVWKLTPPGAKRLQEWNSPWGKGFPGWHLECSAMSQKYLGKQFDIHAGGMDLIPVHHTNEIAQSKAAYGKNPARYWLHGEFLLIEGEKMSKSLGNLVTVEQISQKFNPLAFRYLTLTAHYRSLLNLTWESLKGAQSALSGLYERIWDMKANMGFWEKLTGRLGDKPTYKKYREEFLEAINDDLDTPRALAGIWKMLDDNKLTSTGKLELLWSFDKVLGLDLKKIKPHSPPSKVKSLAKERQKAREEKNWARSDELRKEIEKENWILEDTPKGQKLKPKLK